MGEEYFGGDTVKRIYVICEGKTEVRFVREILNHDFSSKQIFFFPRLLGGEGHKGGRLDNQRLFNDIKKLLLEDKNAYCTTFFDFYALPTDFFGRDQVSDNMPIQRKYDTICNVLDRYVLDKLGQTVARRFIPYVQMYEFEGLLFSSPEKFAQGIDQLDIVSKLKAIRQQFETPEHINDDPKTAPSKRIKQLVKGYQKPVYGVIGALEIGLPTMRQACPIFNTWLNHLAQLPALE